MKTGYQKYNETGMRRGRNHLCQECRYDSAITGQPRVMVDQRRVFIINDQMDLISPNLSFLDRFNHYSKHHPTVNANDKQEV